MAKGGARPGAGRPRKHPPVELSKRLRPVISGALPASQRLTPLDFLLAILRDDRIDFDYRMRAAIAALPFCHPRLADNRFGKRDAALADAYTAGEGSEWADELGSDPRAVN